MKKLLALTFLLWSTASYAFPFKCDKEQTQCEVQTRRLTVGDKVGVFTTEKQLVAIGEVTDIEGAKRIVKITKKWSLLLRNHEIEIINDNAFQNPQAYYTIVTPLPSMLWAGQFAIVNLGIGDGFLGTELSGLFFKHFWRDFSYYGRLHYLSGKGKASDNLGGATSQDVTMSSMGLSGGISEMLLPFSTIAVRLDGELGFGMGKATVSGGFDEGKVLNDRFKDGFAGGGIGSLRLVPCGTERVLRSGEVLSVPLCLVAQGVECGFQGLEVPLLRSHDPGVLGTEAPLPNKAECQVQTGVSGRGVLNNDAFLDGRG